MVWRPTVVIDPTAAALRRLCMGDLQVPGGLVEPGEDPGVPEPPATTLAGLRREAAFAGCRVSSALGSRAAAPAAHFLYRLSDSEMTHEPAARTVHAAWAHSCSPYRLDALPGGRRHPDAVSMPQVPDGIGGGSGVSDGQLEAPATVQNHVSRILDKLQATDRTQAALRAKGLLPPPH
jgi:hypothetical protein